MSTSNVVKSLHHQGSAPDPAGGGYSAPADPLAVGEVTGCSLPKNPIEPGRSLFTPPKFQS